MLQSISAWFKSKGGFAHVVAGIYVFLITGYGVVPSFHSFADEIGKKLPGGVVDAIFALVGLAAWYKNTEAKSERK